jgi:K(+)-stimulated pyrophosphate-energized sodium pump
MNGLFYLPPLLGFAGLISAFSIYLIIKKAPLSNLAIIKIGDAIHSGAIVFMHCEYKMLFLFASVVGTALYFSLGQYTTIAFVTGALCSSFAGYMGIWVCLLPLKLTYAPHKQPMMKAPQRLKLSPLWAAL